MFTILPLALASRAGRGLWELVSPGLVILLFSAACSAQTGRKASAALKSFIFMAAPRVENGGTQPRPPKGEPVAASVPFHLPSLLTAQALKT